MLRRLLTIACMLTALVMCPARGNAGIIDIIWQMSGPQMIGILIECRVGTDVVLDECTAAGVKMAGPANPAPRKIWLSLEGGWYFSTGKDSDGVEYKPGKEFMLAFDPMIEIQTKKWARVMMYHGVLGVSYNFLFGPDFDRFTNVAFKLRPIGFIIGNRVNVNYNLRLYPNGFSADEFGKVPLVSPTNRAEPVHSISVGWRWK